MDIVDECIDKAVTHSLRKRYVIAAKEYLEIFMPPLSTQYNEMLKQEGRIYLFRRERNETTQIKPPSRYTTNIYRKLALKYHPDHNPEGTEMFQRIQSLYESGKYKELHQLYHGDEVVDDKDDEEQIHTLLTSYCYQYYLKGCSECRPAFTLEELQDELKWRIQSAELEFKRNPNDENKERLEWCKYQRDNPDVCKVL